VKHTSSLKTYIVFLLLLFSVSCISTKRVVPQEQRLLPAKSATRAELFDALLERSKEVQTFQGTMTLDLTGGGAKSGVLTEYHQTRGILVVDRPKHLRMKVQAPVVLTTLVDMVSDGKQYRVSIPFKNQFFVGDVNASNSSKTALANLRPQHLLDGLFVDIQPYLNNPKIARSLEETVEGRRSYYVFSFINASNPEAQLVEKLWIDRTDMNISRKQLFGKDGAIQTDVQYSDYKSDGAGKPFPQLIVLQRPAEDYTVKMTFMTTTLNDKLTEDAFNLERPEGSELVQLAK
jgi:outer membrane lipoprotein-sorting protein